MLCRRRGLSTCAGIGRVRPRLAAIGTSANNSTTILARANEMIDASRPQSVCRRQKQNHSQADKATFSFETGHTTFKSINWGRADEQLSSSLHYRKDDIMRVAQQLLSKLPR
jgi:hypothetical protein